MLYRVKGDYIAFNALNSYNNLGGNIKTRDPSRQIYP
jgi:hypothetical protein